MATELNYDLSELGDETATPIILLMMNFKSWPIFVHTGAGVITWNNEDWIGAGDIGVIRASRKSIGLRPARFELALAPILSSYVTQVLSESTWGRLVEMYLGNWNGSGFANDHEPVLFFRGQMGSPKVELGSRKSLVSIEVEDVRGMLERTNGMRSTLLDHNEHEPGDLFYELLPSMMDHTFVFNGEEQQIPVTGRPGYVPSPTRDPTEFLENY